MRLPHNRPIQIRRLGAEQSPWEDLYHRLLRASWTSFFAITLAIYLLLNAVFALLYWFVPGGIAHIDDGEFYKYFAFSVQTMSTVGYGHFYPQTGYAHFVMTIQTGIGLFFTAGLTGLFFAKFAAPQARVIFSDHIILSAQNGKPILCLRLGNFRTNRIFEGRARMTLTRDEISSEGERIRRMIDLKLMRADTPLFALSWTLIHFIDETSPLFNITPEKMGELGWEIFVTFVGLDEDMETNIVAHSNFTADRIVRARKFKDMIELHNGVRVINFEKINEIEYT